MEDDDDDDDVHLKLNFCQQQKIRISSVRIFFVERKK